MPSRLPAERRPRRGAFVSWIGYHGRSQGFIDRLGLTPIYVSSLRRRGIASALFKYGPQFVSTLRALYTAKPEVVFVMDPPVFAVAAVFFYCLHTRARYLMDCHSGVFNSRKWRWSLPAQRLFGRRAAGVLVTNQAHLRTVSSWPATGLIVGDPPPIPGPSATRLPHRAESYVFVIGVFGEDEDIPNVLEAAGRLPAVQFQISGDTRRARPAWLASHPPNVTFTGFLSTEDFWSCVRDASAVLTLTTREDTILRGGWEAMFMEKPLITSRTPALQQYFTRGAVFVDHTSDSIAAGVADAMAHLEELGRQAKLLREEKYATWCEERDRLVRIAGLEGTV
jgi:glycosyltransferase involved in cell wall biosynthesis